MILGRQHGRPLSRPLPFAPLLHHLARHRHQFRIIHRVTEVSHTVPVLTQAFTSLLGEYNTVNSTLQEPVRPVAQQVSYINQDRWSPLVAQRIDGHRCPHTLGRQDLQTGLAARLLEEERDTAIVGVSASADVGAVDRRQSGVVEQAEDAARGPGAAVVALREPGGAALRVGDLKGEAKDVEDAIAEGVALVLEAAELGLMGAEWAGEGLRCSVVDVFAYVECSGEEFNG